MINDNFITMILSNNDNHLRVGITKEYLERVNNEELGLMIRAHVEKIHKYGLNKWDLLLQ